MLHPAIILHPASVGLGPTANVGQSSDCWGEPILITDATLGPRKPFMFVFDLQGKHTLDTRRSSLLHRAAEL